MVGGWMPGRGALPSNPVKMEHRQRIHNKIHHFQRLLQNEIRAFNMGENTTVEV
jgi:hypothetical protein